MLAAAEHMVEADGLTVSLEHVSYEGVIREAGVSRSAAFRLWPSKEDFFLDFLEDLAGPEWQGAATFDADTMDLAANIVAGYGDRLETPEGRRQAMRHAIREAVLYNFNKVAESVQWRTYLALMAMILSAPDGEAKDRLKARLAASEQHFVGRLAEFYVAMAEMLGMKPRPPFDRPKTISEQPLWAAVLATLGSTLVEGMVMRHTLIPDVTGHSYPVEIPNETTEDWSLISLAYLSMVDLVLEPVDEPG
jgi:AcrR family transcriptional regulator